MITKEERAQSLALRQRIRAEKQKVDSLATEIRKRKASTINLSEPIIVLGDAPVIYPNTITVVQGKTGSHKSHVAQNIVSAVIAKEEDANKTMGFRCTPLVDIAVVYIDTERNHREQFPLAIQSILANAGFSSTEDPENLEYCSFSNTPRDIRQMVLDEKLKELRERYGDKHLIVVLDVLTDFVGNFNDEKESMVFIDYLNEMCNNHNASIIGVIHENPGGEKARGHVGTEIGNKASTILQTKYVRTLADGTEVYALNTTKARSDRKPKPVYMQYDSASNNLVVVADSYKPEAEKLNSVLRVQRALPFILLTEMSKGDLKTKVAAETKMSEETVSKALSTILGDELDVEHMVTGKGKLKTRRKGKQMMYFIEATQTEIVPDEDTEVSL